MIVDVPDRDLDPPDCFREELDEDFLYEQQRQAEIDEENTMAKAKKDVVKKGSMDMILGSGGRAAGFEETDSSSYAIPFLRILQKLSPECDKDEPEYVKGAKPGQIYHTIRKAVFDEVEIIPCFYRKTYIEWVLRENGGGFRGEYEPGIGREMSAAAERNDKGQFILPNGNQISETANHYVLFKVSDGVWEPVLISMASSQLKTSRNWMSQLRGQSIVVDGQTYSDLNMEAYQWKARTIKQENDKGKWFGWEFEQGPDTLQLEGVHSQASGTREAVAANAITYDRQQQEGALVQEENAL